MYQSLIDNLSEFHLYIFAFDDLTNEILISLKLKKVTIVTLEEFETPELKEVKKNRSRAEYCWTCTSSIISYVFETFKVKSCTYIDADMYFYDSPMVLLNEIPADKSVIITEHRYSRLARLFEIKRAGRFCVQFIYFNDSIESLSILKKWTSQCIDWCYARYEDGKFGDQKYLDSWPDDYPEVHILQNPGGGVAPWNAMQYNFDFRKDKIVGHDHKSNEDFEVIFFHFHFVRILSEGFVDLGWNWLSKKVRNGFYKPYIDKMISKEQYLESSFPEYKRIYSSTSHEGARETLKHIFKRVFGYNIIKLREI